MRGKNEEMPKSKRRKSKVRLIGSGSSAHLDAYKKRKDDRFTKVQSQSNVRRSDEEIDETKLEESEFVRKIAFKDTTEVCFSLTVCDFKEERGRIDHNLPINYLVSLCCRFLPYHVDLTSNY